MKKTLLNTILIAILLPAVWAQANPKGGEWTIVETFEVPGKASGLAWDGTYIYYGIYGADGDQFYQLDPATGESTLLFTHPEVSDSYGMTWDGEYLWTVHQPSGSSNPALATQLDLAGNTISTIALPDHYMSGIGFDDGNFWVCTYYPDPGTVYKIDDQGAVLESFAPPVYDQLWDVCRQDDFLWFADYNADAVYKTDLTGALLEEHPAENIKPSGIVWDGAYLWYADGQLSSPSTIYKVDLGGAGTPEIQVPEIYHDFGQVTIGDSAVWNVTVNNIGNADLEIENLDIMNAVPVFTYEVFPQTIEAGGSTELELIYKPSEVSMLATIATIQSSDPISPEIELELEGEALLSGPVIYMGEDSHDYGTIRSGAYTRWFIAVSNIGDENLEIESVISDNVHFIIDQNIAFPLVISPLNNVLIGVWFSPVEATTYAGTLTLACNDPESLTLEVTLTGEGVDELLEMGEQFWFDIINTSYDNSPKAINYIKDVNGDGKSDVVVCSEDNYVRCYNANADNTGEVLWEHEIYSGNVYQSEALSSLSDINGDGFDEVVVGTTGGDRSVICVSGKDGLQLWKFQTTTWGDGGWVYEVDAGRDFTNDGIPDVLAAAGGASTGPGAERIFCINGADGSLEWDYYLGGPGFSVISIDDVNGDGIPEALGGASNSDESQGRTICIDGSTGYEIWSYLGQGTSVWALVQLDDINGDGIRDVASGEFSETVYTAFDATNGDILFDGSIGGGFGIITHMVRLDDVNDDGYADFSLASNRTNAIVIDGYNGDNIWLAGLADQASKIDRIPDVSGDAINDLVVGTLYQSNYVYFLDGVTGDILESVPMEGPVDAMAAIPDISDDASWEVVAGEREGRVVCLSGGLDTYTSIPEIKSEHPNLEITLSENPFRDHLVITLNADDEISGHLQILSAGGRLVHDFGSVHLKDEKQSFTWNGTSQISIQALSGLYFVSLSNGRYSKVIKVIKQ